MGSISSNHVILFPFMAQGHFIPFLALARPLEERSNCTITLVTTPLNIPTLRSALPPGSAIRLAELPFQPPSGLPPGTENTDRVPFHQLTDFFLATEDLRPSFESLVSETIQQFPRSRLCIVADVFLGWTVETARKFGAFHSVFVTSGAYGTAIFFSLFLNPPPLGPSAGEDHAIPLEDYPEVSIPRSSILKTILVGAHPMTGFLKRQISLCFQSGGFLLNTAAELEKSGIGLLARMPGVPLWPIGPLVRPQASVSNSETGETCIKWLENHRPGSVLYVSFGSQNAILASQMMNLAMGLEASGRPFIWVVHPPLEFEGEEEFGAEWLPEGFEKRMREEEKGLLVHGWAPQPEILSHPATGGFLSHCGWNSVLESLTAGVPMIGWPLLGDQLYNSMALEEKGVCIVVASGKLAEVEGGWEGVAGAIGVVMGGEKRGEEMRRKAKEIQEVMRGAVEEGRGSSARAMEDFFQTAFVAR